MLLRLRQGEPAGAAPRPRPGAGGPRPRPAAAVPAGVSRAAWCTARPGTPRPHRPGRSFPGRSCCASRWPPGRLKAPPSLVAGSLASQSSRRRFPSARSCGPPGHDRAAGQAGAAGHRLNRTREPPPLTLLGGQRGGAPGGQRVHPAAAAFRIGPAAAEQPGVLQPVQRRVHGAFRQVESALAALAKRRDHRVPVRQARPRARPAAAGRDAP